MSGDLCWYGQKANALEWFRSIRDAAGMVQTNHER